MSFKEQLYVRGEAKIGGNLEANAITAQVETIDAAGALSVSTLVSLIDSTAGAMAISLAAPAKAGDFKIIIMQTDGGDATLTLADPLGAANTAVFANAGETLFLVGTSDGWAVVARNSGAVNIASAFDGPALSSV